MKKAKIQIKLSDIRKTYNGHMLDPKAPFFNSIEDNSDQLYDSTNTYSSADGRHTTVYPYPWETLLESIRRDGYNPNKFNTWVTVSPYSIAIESGAFDSVEDDIEDEKFLLLQGNHRVAICKHLYGDDYTIEVLIDR